MMAQTITCDLCQQEPAVMLETRIETGEVIGVGLACLIPFYVGAAGSLYDELDAADAIAFAPAIQALAAKWADAIAAIEADAALTASAESAPANADDASVTGEGIPATGDGVPQLDGGHDDGGQAADGGQPASPARRARDKARTPR